MKQWITLVPAAAVAVAASAVVALTLDDPSSAADPAVQAAHHDADEPDDADDADEPDDARGRDRGPWRHLKTGPPTWVLDKDHLHDRSWKRKSEWQTLAPAQRGRVMERLAREHADGMKAWQRCVAAERSDLGNACERPLPPGLAKREVGPGA